MKPAVWPRGDKAAERLMVLEASSGAIAVRTVDDLPSMLAPGDLLVVNDAGTMPGSLEASSADVGAFELRLASFEGDTRFRAIVFGAGDYRVPTESRGRAPTLKVGDRVSCGADLEARVTEVDVEHPRLVRLAFAGSPSRMWSRIASVGRPVQYSYVTRPLPLYHVETLFASRPWAAEMPSAGRWLTQRLFEALLARGVHVARVTHAAGLSSTGEPTLDARLPLPERYDVPRETVVAAARAKARGGRIVAVGTSAARALESSARRGDRGLVAGEEVTSLRLGPEERLRFVDAILTGMHEPGTSHFELLSGLARREDLARASEVGSREGFLLHEFGDAMLVLGPERPRLPEAP